jgi:hypothetical protein
MAIQLLSFQHDRRAKVVPHSPDGHGCHHRFAFRSRYLYDLDSVNFALAMERFDPRVHQPHLPGTAASYCNSGAT